MAHITRKKRHLRRTKKETTQKRANTIVGLLREADGAHTYRRTIERKAADLMKAKIHKRNRVFPPDLGMLRGLDAFGFSFENKTEEMQNSGGKRATKYKYSPPLEIGIAMANRVWEVNLTSITLRPNATYPYLFVATLVFLKYSWNRSPR